MVVSARHQITVILKCLCVDRYQFFLQVKRDILQGRLPVQFDLSVELAAYSVQCEYTE